ncbi:MAG: hypothetical protein E6F93_05000 [Actinobacteria bacterium]|nr:MAG: hypothetical protein E6F93_05000 [Actinomycetota bacterium]
MAVRAPQLYRSLRLFGLASFALLTQEVEAGAEIPFSFEEHDGGKRPLYEYRPLLRTYVEARAGRLAVLPDALTALEELRREPAAAIYARAHAGGEGSENGALVRTVLLPLLTAVAEGCGGFDWSDEVFDRTYGELERSLFGTRRAYAAVAPLVGLGAGSQIELGRGIRVRVAAAGELAAHWPDAVRLLPPSFGREPDRVCVLELERPLQAAESEPPDAPGELADAVTALRLATSAAVAAGPVLFERLDWRPYGIRPVLPIAATQPPGEPSRLDTFRGKLARDLLERIASADDDPELAEGLDRWELSLFATEPYRSEQLREALTALLGGTDGLWAATVRTALLLGETARDRLDHLERLRALTAGEPAKPSTLDAVRRALVETLLHADRAALVAALDESLLGLRARPAAFLTAVA